MTYSYTQISQYLSCPRRYRYRYLDGWREKDTHANMLFGRAFEQALAAYFQREDATEVLFRTWAVHQNEPLEYCRSDSWERMLQEGVCLLQRFAQDGRVRIRQPKRDLQMKLVRTLAGRNEFLGYIDAIGELDGVRTVIDWKTTTLRYPDEPEGLLAMDPQLVCYSWLTGEPEVAFVVFVRKHLREIQYLRATISQQQREQFGKLVLLTIRQIESGEFPQHSGIRFPQNGCTCCAYLGLCLGNQQLIDKRLIRRPGGDLGWVDQLHY